MQVLPLGQSWQFGKKKFRFILRVAERTESTKTKEEVIPLFSPIWSVRHLCAPHRTSCVPVLLRHLHPVHARHGILHGEHMEDLRFLHATQDHLLGVSKAEGQNWGGRMVFSRFTWQRRGEPHGRSLLLPSGLQASAVISFPVYSLGCRLHTRWKLAKRCRSSYRKQTITQPQKTPGDIMQYKMWADLSSCVGQSNEIPFRGPGHAQHRVRKLLLPYLPEGWHVSGCKIWH